MKKLFIYAFTLFTLNSFAQTVTDKFAGWANVITVTGNNVTVGQFLGNPTKFDNTFVLSDMQVGDILWTSSCSRFVVTAINGNVVTISDPDTGLSVFPFNGERIGFSREETVNGYLVGSIPQNGDGNAGAISGVSISSNACILNHYFNSLTSAIKGLEIKHEAITTNKTYTSTNLPSAIEVDASTTTVTIDLPITALSKKVTIYRKNTDNSTNPINVNVGGTLYKVMYNQIIVDFINTNSIWSAKL